MKVIGVIPARYGSSRLPGKPLKDICGKPMIQHVCERTAMANVIDEIIVATDDERIVKAVEAFGGKAVITSLDHTSGTDRIAQVVKDIDCDVVVNIQGDEPLIMPEIIDEIAQVILKDSSIVMSTGSYQIHGEKMLNDPNVVKVVCDKNGDALYFSRSLIPYPREKELFAAFEHIGVYAYTKDFLMKYIELPDTPWCKTESLEQLKVLENGYKIRVVNTKFEYNALSVDTQQDLDQVLEIYKSTK